jgi:hypothetical protein
MISLREVHKQLKQIGYRFNFWMRREVAELSEVLDEDETIKQCVNGYYRGGFALLAATNQRLILIDRKPMFLTLEVLWYDKIGQVDYNHRLLNATICVATPNKDLTFTSYNHSHLRQMLLYTQQRMAEANKPEDQSEPEEHQNMNYQGLPEPTAKMAGESAMVQTGSTMQEAEAQTEPQQHLPIPDLADKKPSAYAARLPYSRRRYFARQPQELS